MILSEEIQRIRKLMSLNESKSDEEIIAIAQKYKTPTEFRTGPDQYSAKLAKKRGLWDIATKHMDVQEQTPCTESGVYAEALNYDYYTDFHKFAENTYRCAKRLGILAKATEHMKRLGSMTKRLVYAFEFPDNSVYVGLTYNIERRERQHQDRGSVAEHYLKTGQMPKLKIISDDYIDAKDAQNLEECTIGLYKKLGWNILNKAKAGSIGMCKIVWTRESVKALTQKLTTMKEFRLGYSGAYGAAQRNGWLKDSEITGHLKQKSEYTEESIFDSLKNYNSYKEFRKKTKNTIYRAARDRGLLDKIKQWYDLKNQAEFK